MKSNSFVGWKFQIPVYRSLRTLTSNYINDHINSIITTDAKIDLKEIYGPDDFDLQVTLLTPTFFNVTNTLVQIISFGSNELEKISLALKVDKILCKQLKMWQDIISDEVILLSWSTGISVLLALICSSPPNPIANTPKPIYYFLTLQNSNPIVLAFGMRIMINMLVNLKIEIILDKYEVVYNTFRLN